MRRLSRSDSNKRGTNSTGSQYTSRRSRGLRLGLERLEERRVMAGFLESFGGAADETFFGYSSQHTMDPVGNVYLSGRFYSQNADFDPGTNSFPMSSAGGADAFAAKYRADGSFVWARRFGSAGDDGTSANAFVSEAGTGYLYVAGTFEGSVNFGTVLVPITLTSAGGPDMFFAKLNADTGATIFAKRIGSTTGSEYVYDLAVANGQVFVGGSFNKTLDFDPGTGTAFRNPGGNGKNPSADGFILQLDSNLNYVSSYQFGGNDVDKATGLVAESTSASVTSIYLLGAVGPNSGTVDLDPGTAIKNASGRFIAKYSISTTTVPTWSPDWVGSIGANGGGSVFTDADSLYFVGTFTGAQDFDPGLGVKTLTSAGGSDGVAARYNKANGSFVWANQYGGTGSGSEGFKKGIVVQSVDPVNNRLYLSFRAETASLDFNPGAGNGGEVSGDAAIGYDVLLKLNANSGAYQQVWQMGGTGRLWSRVAGTFGSSVYVAGYFRGTANFPTGGSLTSAGGYDIFLMALDDPTLAPPPAPAPALASTSTGARSAKSSSVESSSVDAALLSLLHDDLEDLVATRKRKKGA